MSKAASANSGKLSDSLCQRLNVYAATAGAACVGMLSAAQPATAQVVYTPAHVVIEPQTSYLLDLGSGFTLTFYNHGTRLSVGAGFGFSCCANSLSSIGSNQLEVKSSKSLLPLALSSGAEISAKQVFRAGYFVMAGASTGGKHGNFTNVKDRYLGFRLYECGFGCFSYYDYGWARFTVLVKDHELEVLLSGYAYESTPRHPIRAGQKSGPDAPVYAPEPDDPESDSGVRSELGLIWQASPQAPLGLLALGAQGLPLWRQRDCYSPVSFAKSGEAAVTATEP